MNVVNCTTRLPKIAGPYQAITFVTGTAHTHKCYETGISWNGTGWDGAGNDKVVAWVDPVAEVAVVAPVVVAAPVEDPLNLSVILAGVATQPQRIGVIKLVRELTGLGLGESKALVESAPKTIKDSLSIPDAAALKAKLEAAGGIVELKAIL
jgi:large subunit ribosomal protein L7/L12